MMAEEYTMASPAERFPPADYILEEMGERGWDRDEMARALGWAPEAVDRLLTSKQRVTRKVAGQLSKALGGSPQYWMNLQTLFDKRPPLFAGKDTALKAFIAQTSSAELERYIEMLSAEDSGISGVRLVLGAGPWEECLQDWFRGSLS